MQLQRIWTDAEAEIRFWQLMRRIEDVQRPGRLLWRLTLGPQRSARQAGLLRREAETLVDRFTLPPGAVGATPAATALASSDTASLAPGQGERLARIHSAIRVAATLANDAAGAPTSASAREHRRL